MDALSGDRVRLARNKRKLTSLTGFCGKVITAAYMSVSNEAACVLAALPPLYLIVEEKMAKAKLKTENAIEVFGTHVSKGNFSCRQSCYKHIRTTLMNQWQDQWDETEKGSITYKFLPEVSDRRVIK